jgi:hypothetical protein
MKNRITNPIRNKMLAMRSSKRPLLLWRFSDKKDNSAALIKNTIATLESSSINVKEDLLKNRSDVITRKQMPIRLDEALSTCGERGSFIRLKF